ncbi:Uma2 family endonuclease [Methylobacter sp. Wu8]|uniref:Uma2 family endonuclease n=1 Tax=Methylobacter tundripaludum TaxID=173365 RepID=A0A2S6GJC5_9GAMM|nr:Uma2 family endonuclease [Methylobacter tundripaludum]MCK9636837.1 Uma2 family endonuclease [Methylobacter tundripaludum]PPK65334.1 Uma2 family endonuclease [Methylobacter tundripaludum]
MALQTIPRHISAEEYLQGELLSDIKHQLIDGEVYAMAGASENHNLLAGNIFSELKNHLKGTPCRTFMADMKVRVAEDFFYPDVMVVCAEDNEDEYYKKSPVIIVEVLSKTTRKFDQTRKRIRCQTIPTLQEYVLIEQDKGEIQVFSRSQNWQSSYYYLGDSITFHSLGITISVEDIYYQVNNEDVLAFSEQKTVLP